MATGFPTQQEQSAAYEQYVRANWHSLSAFEQEQARAFVQARYPQFQTAASTKMAPRWMVPLGYVCCAIAILFIPIPFAPAGFGLGIYNAKHGQSGHGTAQMVLSVVCGMIGFILGMIVWAAV
ncbi:MAG TPA: hypothetical protein VKB09_02305 [Thermomicrobiales bacterium]|nr:hypothetical protein [Thermomicrobiales bacterium]